MPRFRDREDLSREAESRLPLRRLMETRGDVPKHGKREFKACPICGAKDSSGFFEWGGKEFFKCHHSSCPSGAKALNAIAYLKLKENLSGSDAYWTWVKEAGIDVAEAKRDLGAALGGGSRPQEPETRNPKPSSPPSPEDDDCADAEASADAGPEDFTVAHDADAPAPLDPPPSPEPDPSPVGESHPADQPQVAPPEPPVSEAPAGSGPGQPASPTMRDDSPIGALRRFYELAADLPEAEQRRLWRDRGLLPETVKAAGLKWSCAANTAVIEGMLTGFTPTAMQRGGLLTKDQRSKTGRLQPNNQLCGWGPTGKILADGRDEWAEINPVLIPFFNHRRELLTLRCHKRSLPGASPQLYIAMPDPPVATPRWVAICESEFKALAVRQVLPAEVMVCGLCGISNAKNWFVMDSLVEWLEAILLPDDGKVVAVFDNEDKSTPGLPGYNPNEFKQHDSLVWARYLVGLLVKHGFPAEVGLLPNDWRNKSGKADWDGALAGLIEASGVGSQAAWPDEATGVWQQVAQDAASSFRQVLRQAVPEKQVCEVAQISERAQWAIDRKLERVAHEPNIHAGSNYPDGEEQRTASRLRACVREIRRRRKLIASGRELTGPAAVTFGPAAESVMGSWLALANLYEEMRGRMYFLKPIQEAKSRGNPQNHDDGSNTMSHWRFRQTVARDAGDLETAWACALAAKGWPVRMSDFTIAPKFYLRKTDGELWRMCEMNNIHGVARRGESSGLIPIPSEALVSTDKFRKWLSVSGGFSFQEGNTPLQLFTEDLNHALAGRFTDEVAVHGWHEKSSLWFTADCAFNGDGQVVLPNKHAVFWHQRKGWRLAVSMQTGEYVDCDKNPQPMHHGACRMQPDKVLVRQGANGDATFKLRQLPDGKSFVTEQDPAVLRDLYLEVRRRMCDSLGGEDGAMAVAMMLMSAAGPEIYERYTQISGLCANGEHGHGKSTVGRWLMGLWGYRITGGVDLKKTSIAGLHVAGQQYCYQPVWLEEFNARDDGSEVEESLKGWFDRTGGSKVGASRTVRAVAFVTGQTSFNRPATRERYAQILVHKEVRRRNPDGTPVNHFRWMQDHRDLFFAIGRHVLLHRKRFAALVLEQMNEWITDDTMQKFKERPRFVFASAWASLKALETLLGHTPSDEEDHDYFLHLVRRCSEAEQETRQRTEVDAWLADVLTAFHQGLFQRNGADDLHKAFKVELVNRVSGTAPGTVNQKDWFSWQLYINPELVMRVLRQELRRGGEEVPLDKGDVKAQLGQRPCWVQQKRTVYLKGVGGSIRAWCLDLDKLTDHGYLAAGDDEVREAHTRWTQAVAQRDGMGANTRSYWWEDPRRGGYFAIVQALCKDAYTIQNQDGTETMEGID